MIREVEDGLQAVIAFNGDVYGGLAARELDRPALEWAQDHLRILSGLYGVLRPLDALQPYRLEMGTRLKTKRGSNLYDFWGETIAQTLNAAAQGHADPTLVNLASQEYFGAVDAKALKLPVVTCHFKEEKAGLLKVLGFFAKKARGRMARYIIDNRVEQTKDLKAFDLDGYAFRAELSTSHRLGFRSPPTLNSSIDEFISARPSQWRVICCAAANIRAAIKGTASPWPLISVCRARSPSSRARPAASATRWPMRWPPRASTSS